MSIRVAIAGGGLAGLACAKYLIDAGLQVTIIESLPYLGGRASTYRDADGEWVEQGLHLFLGAYTEFKKLLQDVGVAPDDALFWMDELRLQDPNGPDAVYGVNPLHAPLKTVFGFLGQNDYLGLLSKLSLGQLVAPALSSLDTLRQRYDGMSVYEWWKQSSGKEEVLERFLRPFCRAIQFTDAEQFSAYDFLGWVHHAVYHLRQSRIGGYRGAREEIIFRPLSRYLRQRGVEIHTGLRLEKILYQPDLRRVTGFGTADGGWVQADAYVVAIPGWSVVPLLPEPLRLEPFFSEIGTLPVAPAIAVQIWFDRQVIDTPDYFLVARGYVPAYQEQSLRTYPSASGSRISTLVAPADDLLTWDEPKLVTLVTETLSRVVPAMRHAKVLKSVVLKHHQHLIRPLPGVLSRRPAQRTPVPNLFLAGDWTQQDFFGSQEGAVRSGSACAREVVRELLPALAMA
jgi:15-cis-phytoene desaturase